MRRHDQAKNEQFRTLISPEPGLDGTRATVSQITGFRRRPENIIIAMIDKDQNEQTNRVKRVHGPHQRAAQLKKHIALKDVKQA